jgi:predicted PurR-regulated permease PerM
MNDLTAPPGDDIGSSSPHQAPIPKERGLRWKPGPAAVTVLVVLAVLHTVYFAREFFLPIAAAYFLKLAFTPPVRALRRWGIPEPFGATLVLSAILASAGLAALQLAGPANEWIARAPGILRQVSSELRVLRKPVENFTRAAEQVEAMTGVGPPDGTRAIEVRGPSLTNLLFQSTGNFLAMVVATVVLLYLMLAAGDLFLRKAIAMLPRLEDKVAAVDLSRELEHTISNYLLTVGLINMGLGFAVGFSMHWLGMPNPHLWGMMSAIFNFVPYVGALASFTVLFFAAYVTFDDVARALLVGGVFLGVNSIESYLVTPSIVGRRMSMNPVAIFIAMIFFGWAWGIYGLLLAVPILSMLRLACEHVDSLRPVAELIGA